MEIRHQNCEDAKCRICWDDHMALQKRLEDDCGDGKRTDHLGKYHKWLSDSGITPETDHGWATTAAFDEVNIAAYVESRRGA